MQQCNQAGPGLGRTVPHSDLVVDKAPRNTITGKLQSIAVILHIQVPVLWICCLGLFLLRLRTACGLRQGIKLIISRGQVDFILFIFVSFL